MAFLTAFSTGGLAFTIFLGVAKLDTICAFDGAWDITVHFELAESNSNVGGTLGAKESYEEERDMRFGGVF